MYVILVHVQVVCKPLSTQGSGTHNSSIFKPGEKISLYVEPAGYSYKPLMNFTADIVISDKGWANSWRSSKFASFVVAFTSSK